MRGIRQAALLAVIALLALAPAALGQVEVKPMSLVYIQVEPQGLGEVGYYPSPEPAGQWPRATTPIGGLFTMAFPQGTYLYLEARPYGCAELDRWEITPQNANWTYYEGSRERIILPLSQDYITVKAVFTEIPEDKCPYIPIWRSMRVRRSDLTAGVTVSAVAGAATGLAYAAKRRGEERRRREENVRRRVEEVRRRLLEENMVDWRRPAMIGPWQIILFTCLKWPGLEEAKPEELRAALMDDAILRRLRDIQGSGIAGLGHCYIADAMDMYTGNIPLLGLKTYLALFNLAPSTDRITKMYLAGLDPDRLPILWYNIEGERELRRMLELIRRNIELQRKGLEQVIQLMKTDPEYARRIREPPEYYETLLRFIQGWAAENLGITFRGIRIRPREPQAPGKPGTGGEAGKPVKEEAERVEMITLPDKVPMPKWLADAVEYWEKEGMRGPEKGAEAGKAEEAGKPGRARLFRIREEPEKGVRILPGKAPPEALKEAPRPPPAPKPTIIRPERPEEAEEKPEKIIEAEPKKGVKAKPGKAETPVSWDELPAPLQRQIEGLGLTLEEAASIAIKTMGGGEKDVYREVNRLLSQKYPDMGEQDMISTLMMAVNTITWLQAILEEEGVKPVEGAASQAVEEQPEKVLEEVKPEEAVKPVEHVEKERVEEARVEEAEEIEKSVEEVEEQPAAEATSTAAPKEAGIYDEVRVDRIEVLRPPIRALAGELYLIDVPGMSASWIPTSLIVELFHGSPSCKPITFERRRHYSRDVMDELLITLKKTCMIGGMVPVIVIGRPGHTLIREEGTWIRVKNIAYVEKLKQLLSVLKEAKIRRYAVAMPLQVYKQYCMNIPELQATKKVVYVVDVDGVTQKLSGKIPDGALPYLRMIAALSPSLLQELLKSPRQVTWRPTMVEGTGEEEALIWAVRTIYSKGGPLTAEEVVRAGYKDYLDRFIVLGMVEKGVTGK
jgi:hypothetical protein